MSTDRKKAVELRREAQGLSATVYVGKEGVTGAVSEEVREQLKKKKLVKVRLLPAFAGDRHECASQLAHDSSSVLVEVRGRTVVLATERAGAGLRGTSLSF